jgi:hypothetical protein
MEYDTFPLQTYIPTQQTSGKRKREHDNNDFDVVETPHILKKQRDEVPPVTLPSPPSSLASLQSFSPRSDQEIHRHYNAHRSSADIEIAPPLSEPTQFRSEQYTPISSDVEFDIPSHNVFLRNVHLNSRPFLQNQKQMEMDKDEMWEDEEEAVAERYAAMNKLLGSRRRNL